jgi:hypothetical protein
MSQQITWNFGVIRGKSIGTPPIFSKFQLWSQIWQRSSWNFVVKFLSYKVQLITFPKRYLSSKAIHGNRRYLQFYARKRVKPNEIYIIFSSIGFWPISHAFWHKIEDISGFRGWILMKDSVLETLWVALCMIKISPQYFTNFTAKFGSKVDISWKLEEFRWIFINNSKVSGNLLRHTLLFWKVSMPAI